MFGRVGLIARGVSYALVGVLAIGVALGIGGDATSRNGALHSLAGNTFGEIVLALLTAGFSAYALWGGVQGGVARQGGEGGGDPRRAGPFFRGGARAAR